MKIRFTRAPTFTKAITAAAVFAVTYLASASSLPSCSDTVAALSSGGECLERQSFLHTASGWLALICLLAAVLLLALRHKESILARPVSARPAHAGTSARVPVPGPDSRFCTKCGTRIMAGDTFCQGCGNPMGSPAQAEAKRHG